MADHERIWLQHPDDEGPDGRLWCQDKIWPMYEEEREPTEYVRADLLAEARAQIAALAERHEKALVEGAARLAERDEARAQIAAKDAALRDILAVNKDGDWTSENGHIRCREIARQALAAPARET